MKEKFLNTIQLNRLEQIILDDCRKRKTSKRTRFKILLIFFLARYGALRLKEIKALNREDFLQNGYIRITGNNNRIVLLPFFVREKIHRLLTSPELCGIQNQLIDLDDGFIRRVMYNYGGQCGFSPAQVNLRALREGRRAEMLRSGLSESYMRYFLGTGITAVGEEKGILSVIENFLAWEEGLCTSARNKFIGTVQSVEKKDIMGMVTLKTISGLSVQSLITMRSIERLGIKPGSVINALIKALHVHISFTREENVSNIFCGVPELITKGEEFAEIKLILEDNTELCAVCPSFQLDEYNFTDKTIYFYFSAADVILQPTEKFNRVLLSK